MSDFSKTIATFFRSDCEKYSEYKELMKEAVVQEEWLTAVALYRKGILALQKNDVNALEIIRQANESLKQVVSTKGDKVSLNLKALNESILELNETNINDIISLIKFNFGMLYESCKEVGMKQVLNEENFYEEESTEEKESITEEDGDGGNGANEVDEEVVPPTEVPPSTEPIAPEPVTAEQTPTPEATSTETETATPVIAEPTPPTKSGYAEGFAEGCKFIQSQTKDGPKFENAYKESLAHIIETSLHSESYSRVQSYKEGFAHGCKFQERILQEMHPVEYKKFTESKSK